MPDIAALEAQLNSFDREARRSALAELVALAERGDIALPPQTHAFNLHCHSFFSYNGYGYSPTALAWQGRRQGLYAMGLVDFDVVEGVEEFLEACAQVGLRRCAGMETRIFVPEFSDREINSPGEPGISYHMGAGFTTRGGAQPALQARFLDIAQQRNKDMIARINPHLDPVAIDYERDVLPLSPRGNPTERHLCIAYDERARQALADEAARVAFWAEKLGVSADQVCAAMEDPPVFQGLIRSKTMKRGGAGYAQPEGDAFPRLEEVNRFTLDNGGLPTYAFLHGLTPGEQAMDELLDLMQASGVAAVNIIPDRNWNINDPAEKRKKVDKLYAFVDNATRRHLPILAGTEMNAYGQRFVDDFDAPELKPLLETFLEGVHILHGHTLFQQHAGMGYLSDWAGAHFENAAGKNRFYRQVGEKFLNAKDTAFLSIAPTNLKTEVAQALGIHLD